MSASVPSKIIFPTSGYLRLSQIVGNPRTNPPTPAIIPIGKSTWWRWVAEGKVSKGRKLGPKIRVWTPQEIGDLLTKLASEQEG